MTMLWFRYPFPASAATWMTNQALSSGQALAVGNFLTPTKSPTKPQKRATFSPPGAHPARAAALL